MPQQRERRCCHLGVVASDDFVYPKAVLASEIASAKPAAGELLLAFPDWLAIPSVAFKLKQTPAIMGKELQPLHLRPHRRLPLFPEGDDLSPFASPNVLTGLLRQTTGHAGSSTAIAAPTFCSLWRAQRINVRLVGAEQHDALAADALAF